MGALASSEGEVIVYDLRREIEPCGRWCPHRQAVRSISLDPTQRYLASASMDGNVAICDLWCPDSTAACLSGHTTHVASVAWHGQWPLLLSTCADGCVRLWGPASK